MSEKWEQVTWSPTHCISTDCVVEVEEDTEASVRKGGMCRFGENVIIRKTFFSRRESLRPKSSTP